MNKHIRSLLFPSIVIGIAIWAIVPLLGKNYIPTHDGEYHIIRIVEFSKMLSAGHVIPRWAPGLNSGYGSPILEFHYPLPNYIGSIIRVFSGDAVRAFQIGIAIGYIITAVGIFLWLQVMFGSLPAAVGAIIAIRIPYIFVDMYVRGSIGELWAMAFLFLCLYFNEKKRFGWFAVSFALLILSHNILAMIFTPLVFGYAYVRNRKAIAFMLYGIGISAFFWIPALLESKFVVGLNTVNFREHFVEVYELLIPSWGTQFSGSGAIGNKMSVQIGIIPILVLLTGLWTVKFTAVRQFKILFWFFLGSVILSLFFMLPVSDFLWRSISALQLMQYPWRLLSLLVPAVAFCSAFWVFHIKRQWLGIPVALAAIVLTVRYATPVQYTPRNEQYYLSRPNFTDSTSSMGNSFSTIWTGWKPARATSPITITDGRLEKINKNEYLRKEFEIFMDSKGVVTVHTLYFPGWTASIDGYPATIEYETNGIIEIQVPSGPHTLRVEYKDTIPRSVGNAFSFLSLSGLLLMGYTSKRK